jgi:hypothetical protein
MAQVFGRTWRRLRRTDVVRDREVMPAPTTPAAATPVSTRPAANEDAPARMLVDAGTRTWWKPGAARTETLVETLAPRAPGASAARRIAAIGEARLPAGPMRRDRAPGLVDPAFTELLLVELLRAGRWERAFALLAPPCQAAWGTPQALAAANAAASRRITGARVASVCALDRWKDPERDMVWEGVAELVVEYAIGSQAGVRHVRRTVHLVDVDGRWRSLLFPPPVPEAS